MTVVDLPALPESLTQRGGDPNLLRDELLSLITQRIDAHPRTLQVAVGPSGLGTPCARRLAHKLLGSPEVNQRSAAWKPTVGTAVHTWLQGALQAWNDAHTYDRFYLEERVHVGDIGGQPVYGNADVYDRVVATVVDWKIVGLAGLKRYRIDGPGDQYRAQAHLYGRGFRNAGLPVDHVSIMFLPQNGELADAHWWTEPYDESVALEALTRANGVAALTAALGQAAPGALPTADAFCSYCPYYVPAVTDLTTACPGHRDQAHSSAGDVPAATAAPAA